MLPIKTDLNFVLISARYLKTNKIRFCYYMVYESCCTHWNVDRENISCSVSYVTHILCHSHKRWTKVQIIVCLCWGLTSQSTIFQSCRDGATAPWVINQYFRGVKCLAQGHNTAAAGFEPPTSRSGVRHSTTEPPRSPKVQIWDDEMIYHEFHNWARPWKICFMSYANNKCADQPAHPRSLISAFVVRCFNSIISLDSIAEISRL